MQRLSRQRGVGTQRGYGYTNSPAPRYTLRDYAQQEAAMATPAPEEVVATTSQGENAAQLGMIRDPEQRIPTSALQSMPVDPRFNDAMVSAGRGGLMKLGTGMLTRGLMGAEDLVTPSSLASVGTNMAGNFISDYFNLGWKDPKTVNDGRFSTFKNPATRLLSTVGSVGANKVVPGTGPVGNIIGTAAGDLIDDATDTRRWEGPKDYLEDTESYLTARERFNQASDLIDNPQLGGRKVYRDPNEWLARDPAYDKTVPTDNTAMQREETNPTAPSTEPAVGYGNIYVQRQSMARSASERGNNAEESGVERAERMMREAEMVGKIPGLTDWSDPMGNINRMGSNMSGRSGGYRNTAL